MKLVLNSFFLLIFIICPPALGNTFYKEYTIYSSGVKIGKLNWEVNIDNKDYSNRVKLESGGILSKLYNFKGDYFSSGNLINKKLTPKKYTHSWKTNKINKIMYLVFKNNKLKSLEQNPNEKESLRLNIFEINKAKDPLTSFLQIIFGADKSLVVDGRRLYTMNATYNKKKEQIDIEIADYSNLWADHKRSDFEKVSFKIKNGDVLPNKIFVYFDGRVFKIREN